MGRHNRRRGEQDDRPPICPACGVTQGMVVSDDDRDEVRFVCLECGFSEGEQLSGEQS